MTSSRQTKQGVSTRVEQAIEKHREECNEKLSYIYISWNKFLAILGTITLITLTGTGASSWALSRQITQIEMTSRRNSETDVEQNRKIENLESVVGSIKSMETDVKYIRERLVD